MPVFVDQLGRNIRVSAHPQRIISLVPSQTELLFHLGLDKEVVGITKFCVHPAQWHQAKTRIGGTRQINIEKIKLLQPDLIIANKEENVQAQIAQLEPHFPVWVSDVNNLEEAQEMIRQIGAMVNKEDAALKIIYQMQDAFLHLQQAQKPPLVKACYLIWKDPYMTVGGDTFINAMLQHAGFENVFAHQNRYPTVTVEEIAKAGCQAVLLSSEPYPFKQKHINALQPLLPGVQILLADGEYFSWYGSRLAGAPNYFLQLRQQIQPIG